jgi:hypothetical protein
MRDPTRDADPGRDVLILPQELSLFRFNPADTHTFLLQISTDRPA